MNALAKGLHQKVCSAFRSDRGDENTDVSASFSAESIVTYFGNQYAETMSYSADCELLGIGIRRGH